MELFNSHICPFCGREELDMERHLKKSHFLSMQEYYEMDSSWKYENGDLKSPLTYIDPTWLYLPNWSQVVKNGFEKKQAIVMVQTAIKDYFSRIISDRYLQMFLVNKIYFRSTLSHTYSEFKKVLKDLKPLDRNKIWFLDWIDGYPITISKENIGGIKLVPIDMYYNIENTNTEIKVNNWKIELPKQATLDKRNHSSYNILNSNAVKPTRRLRLKEKGDDECIQLFNTNRSTVFSLFNINGETKLTEQDLTVIKLVLLRNKEFMKYITYMISEVLSYSGIYSDSVFLRNTVLVNPDHKALKVNLCWLPEEEKNNYINISILTHE